MLLITVYPITWTSITYTTQCALFFRTNCRLALHHCKAQHILSSIIWDN